MPTHVIQSKAHIILALGICWTQWCAALLDSECRPDASMLVHCTSMQPSIVPLPEGLHPFPCINCTWEIPTPLSSRPFIPVKLILNSYPHFDLADFCTKQIFPFSWASTQFLCLLFLASWASLDVVSEKYKQPNPNFVACSHMITWLLFVLQSNNTIRRWDMLTVFLGLKSYQIMTSLSQVYHIYGKGTTHMFTQQFMATSYNMYNILYS